MTNRAHTDHRGLAGVQPLHGNDIPPPIIDSNGDGNTDCTNICIMTEFWGTDESLCDIAPPPFGDGVVDVQDLILLSEHLMGAVDDPNALVDPDLAVP